MERVEREEEQREDGTEEEKTEEEVCRVVVVGRETMRLRLVEQLRVTL